MSHEIAVAALLALALGAPPARAQPPMGAGGMPDLRTMSGKPLPVSDLAPGTVTVRVARKMPVNAVAGAEVTAIVVAPGGESRKHAVKTGSDGRATFEGLRAGSQFKAEVTVDGERLETSSFSIPAQGGTRIMLIAGLGKAPAPSQEEPAGGAAGGQGEDPFARAAITGSVKPEPTLPKGALELELVGPGGKRIADRVVKLGEVSQAEGQDKDKDKGIKVHQATSDAKGVARFDNLTTGESAGYAAVVDHEGMRLSTDVFRMPADTGMRGQIRALERTSDPSSIRIDNRSTIIFEAREDALVVMHSLVFKNVSDRIFDPGEGGLVLPLPDGFANAQELPGGAPVEARAREGVAVRTAIPPSSSAAFATQARFAFFLPAGGASTVDYRQPMPTGMESPLIVIRASDGLTVQGPGVRRLPDKADKLGNKVVVFETDEVRPGGTLALSVLGLPTRDRSGRNVAATLALLLVAAAVIFARRPKQPARAGAKTQQSLVERREKLFGELVAVEQRTRQGGGGSGPPADAQSQRRELVVKLEAVYRELAALERQAELPA